MVKKLEEAVIARIKKGGQTFEILVDIEKALAFRDGKIKDIREVLICDEIFRDARKGERVSFEQLKKIFGTDDIYRIAEIIVQEGEVQITTEYKRKLIEEKKKEIIMLIHRNAVDPRTRLPHPPSRIEAAMEKAGVKIDPFKPVEQQLEEVIKKIKYILPLKFEKIKLAIRIPPEYTGKAVGFFQRNFKILKDEWASDGSWIVLIEIPAGMREEVIEKVSGLTHGNAQFKEVKNI